MGGCALHLWTVEYQHPQAILINHRLGPRNQQNRTKAVGAMAMGLQLTMSPKGNII